MRWVGEGINSYAVSCMVLMLITYRIERITTSMDGISFHIPYFPQFTSFLYYSSNFLSLAGAARESFAFPSFIFYSAPLPTNMY